MEWIPAAVPVLAVCLPCLHTGGLQPAAQGVDADTKFLGNLCARTALFCHHPDRSGLERLVVPGRRYPFLRLFSISFVPFPFHYNECFFVHQFGKGGKNVSLQLDTNWRLGLVGRNGRGKTTLLRRGAMQSASGFQFMPTGAPLSLG